MNMQVGFIMIVVFKCVYRVQFFHTWPLKNSLNENLLNVVLGIVRYHFMAERMKLCTSILLSSWYGCWYYKTTLFRNSNRSIHTKAWLTDKWKHQIDVTGGFSLDIVMATLFLSSTYLFFILYFQFLI